MESNRREFMKATALATAGVLAASQAIAVAQAQTGGTVPAPSPTPSPTPVTTPHCQQGYIDMDPGFSYEGLQLRVKTGEEDQGDVSETQLRIPQINQFAAEIDHFSECILNDTDPRTPGEEGLADMRVILAIEEAYRTGGPVAVNG